MSDQSTGVAPPTAAARAAEVRGATRGKRAAILVILLLSSCSFFSKSKPTFYSLDVVPGTQSSVRAGARTGIGTVELPPGLDRREIVVRHDNGQLEVRESQMWSANLGQLVMHTLAFDLAGRLPEGMMVLPGEAKPVAMRSIDVAFGELAAGPGNAVTLHAQWTLHDPGRPDVVHREHIAIDVPSLDSANIAIGTSRVVAALADRIAAQI